MIEAHIRALEQSTMIALTLFASQSKQIIIKIRSLRCQIVDFTLLQYIVIRIAIRPCLSQYIAIHFLVAIWCPSLLSTLEFFKYFIAGVDARHSAHHTKCYIACTKIMLNACQNLLLSYISQSAAVQQVTACYKCEN